MQSYHIERRGIMDLKMTVGKRIGLGFAVVILITLAVGGMGIWNMLVAKTNSAKLAEEYIPEVKIANDLRGASNRVMYQMRGYGLTEEDDYHRLAQEEMEAVNKALTEAGDLAAKARNLKALKGHVDEANTAVKDYAALMKQTEETIAAMKNQRVQLDQNAASYMQNCAEFLNGQNEAFGRDLDDRQHKITLATNIVDLGTQVRVANFKAQANADTALMDQAIENLDELKKFTGELEFKTI